MHFVLVNYVVTRLDHVMYQHKWEHALAEVMNHQLTALTCTCHSLATSHAWPLVTWLTVPFTYTMTVLTLEENK